MVKNYAEVFIKVLSSCPILIDFFNLFQIFCQRFQIKELKKELLVWFLHLFYFLSHRHRYCFHCQSIVICLVSILYCSRSSHQRCSMREGILRNFTKFRPTTLLKRRLQRRCFPVNFVKFLRTLFFTEHLWTTASVVVHFETRTNLNQKEFYLSWSVNKERFRMKQFLVFKHFRHSFVKTI